MRPRERGPSSELTEGFAAGGGGAVSSFPRRLQVRSLNTGAKHVVRKGDIRALLLTL